MATATVTNDVSSNVNIKNFNETYRVYAKAGADGKIDPASIRMVTQGKDGATWKKLDDPTSGYTQAFEQSVKMYEAGTIAGAQELVEDPTECVNIWNKGAGQKTLQRLKSEFIEISEDGMQFTFDPKPEAYDTLELLSNPTQRRFLSPATKAENGMRASIKILFPTLEGDALEAKLQEILSSLGV